MLVEMQCKGIVVSDFFQLQCGPLYLKTLRIRRKDLTYLLVIQNAFEDDFYPKDFRKFSISYIVIIEFSENSQKLPKNGRCASVSAFLCDEYAIEMAIFRSCDPRVENHHVTPPPE